MKDHDFSFVGWKSEFVLSCLVFELLEDLLKNSVNSFVIIDLKMDATVVRNFKEIEKKQFFSMLSKWVINTVDLEEYKINISRSGWWNYLFARSTKKLICSLLYRSPVLWYASTPSYWTSLSFHIIHCFSNLNFSRWLETFYSEAWRDTQNSSCRKFKIIQ